MKTALQCPVSGCDWEIDTTPPDTSDAILADIFGPGIMAAHHRNTVSAATERRTEAHLKTHTVLE